MAYVKTTWVDRAVQHAARYALTLVSGTTYDIAASPGTVTDAGTTTNAAKMNNIENGIEAAHKGTHVYGASTSGNDTYVVTLSPVFVAYNAGMIVNLKPDTSNTGAATINVDGLGAKTIKKFGPAGKADIDTGDIIANGIYTLIYDGTDFVLINLAEKVTQNSGTFTETSSVSASSNYEKNVALGSSDYNYAIVMFADNSGHDLGGIIMTGITATSAIANYAWAGADDGIRSGSRTTETELQDADTQTKGLVGGAHVSLVDCYINGSNLYFKWTGDGTGGALAITVHWRVMR